MSIRVRCQCGAWLRATDNMAGKTVRCVSCQQPVRIEADLEESSATPPQVDRSGDDNPWGNLASSLPAPVERDDQAVNPRKRHRPTWLLLAFAAGAGGGLVCLVGVAILFLVMRPSGVTNTPARPNQAGVSSSQRDQPATDRDTDIRNGWDDRTKRPDFDPWVPPRVDPIVKVGPGPPPPPQERECLHCRGTGNGVSCLACRGTGLGIGMQPCLSCGGRRFQKCGRCNGTGRMRGNY